MKILFTILVATFFATTPVFAHTAHEHATGAGLFGLPPEYIHVLINPLPVYGLAMGILALAVALIVRNKTAQAIGLGLIIVASASAWPVTHFGTNAYERIRDLSDEASVEVLDEHMERAEKWIYLFYAAAVFGVVALIVGKKFPKVATRLAVITLLLGVGSLVAGGWIAKAGGQIRHVEFRAAPSTLTNEHPTTHPNNKSINNNK